MNPHNYYNNNINQIKVNKRTINNNIKTNFPPHQENNYYYNTKINRLILQEAPNNNRTQNFYQQPILSNMEYDFLANNVNNIIPEKKPEKSFYKKISNYQKPPITVKTVNENEISNYFNRDENGFKYVNINRNTNYITNPNLYNSFNNRIINNPYGKYSGDDFNSNSFQKRINNFQKNESLYLSQINNNKYSQLENNLNMKYNTNFLQHSMNANDNLNYRIDNDKSTKCKKISIKNEKIGNYYIKNPGMPEQSRINNLNKNKYRYKSPEIILIKNKLRNINFDAKKNKFYNDEIIDSREYKSGFSFYKKKEEMNKNNSYNYMSKKNNTPNKIETNGNNKTYNLNINQNNNLIIEKEEVINVSNDIYSTIDPKRQKIINIEEKNRIKRNMDDHNLNKSIKNNLRNYTKNELKDYNSMKKNIENFCEILEQFYFTSFKKYYKNFIQNLDLCSKNKNSNRAFILRRFNDGNRTKINNIKNTNRITNNNIKEVEKALDKEQKEDPLIKHYYTRRKNSPLKFIELKNNLTNSMMKINQDNYIKIFNDIFKKGNKEEKRSQSPFVYGENSLIQKNNSIKSFDFENEPKKTYDKYNTNTNVDEYIQKKNIKKFNNLKINTELFQPCNENLLVKRNLRTTINAFYTDNETDNTHNYNYESKYNSNNNKGRNEIDDLNYDEDIFQKQNYKISNSIDSFLDNKNINNKYKTRTNNPDKQVYKKINKVNAILYSKPLLKKSKTKYLEQKQINNMSAKDTKQYNPNIQLGNYYSINNTLNRSLNYSREPRNTEQKKLIEDYGNYENINEIIIKNVRTEDKRIHVFIKYIPLEDIKVNNRDKLISKLLNMKSKSKKNYSLNEFICAHTDSINLIAKNNNYEINFILKKTGNIFLQNNNNRYSVDEEENNSEERDIKNNLREDNNKLKEKEDKILIGEEEENKNNNYIFNEDLKNSANYLMSLLKNKYDDNKKSILYTFFKNLRKIKTTSLLYSTRKFKEKNNLSISQSNIVKQKRSEKIAPPTNNHIKLIKMQKIENSERETDIQNKKNLKMKRNFKNYNLGENIGKEKSEKILNKDQFLGNIKKLKEEAIKIKKMKSDSNLSKKSEEKNELNKENNEEKEKIKKKKLEKLEKLFNNLNQENNIINSIKKQFLEWTYKNDFPLKKNFGNNDLDKYNNKNKEYEIKTFDLKNNFNNKISEKENNGEIIDEYNKKINIFRNKLISFSLKNNKNESINSKEELDRNKEKESENSEIGKYEFKRSKKNKNLLEKYKKKEKNYKEKKRYKEDEYEEMEDVEKNEDKDI